MLAPHAQPPGIGAWGLPVRQQTRPDQIVYKIRIFRIHVGALVGVRGGEYATVRRISLNFVKLLVYYMECICRRERECSLYLRITRKLCVRLNMSVCVCGCILCPNIANIRAHMCVCCDAYEHTAVRDGRNEGFHIGAGASEKTEFLSRAPHIVRLIGLGVCSCVCGAHVDKFIKTNIGSAENSIIARGLCTPMGYDNLEISLSL